MPAQDARPMTTVSVLYGGVNVPAEQVIRVIVEDRHNVVCEGKHLPTGTELVFVVRTKSSTTPTNGYANLFLMSPGIPQLVSGCHVHAKKRGRGVWVEWDFCRNVADWVKRILDSGTYIHLAKMPEGFSVVTDNIPAEVPA